MLGSHYTKGWSKAQATRALPSAEADLYAAAKTSAELIGMVSIYSDCVVAAHGSIGHDLTQRHR